MRDQFTLRTLAPTLLFLVLAPRALASNAWFVDGVNGNDKNDCKSLQTRARRSGMPFRWLRPAIL